MARREGPRGRGGFWPSALAAEVVTGMVGWAILMALLMSAGGCSGVRVQRGVVPPADAVSPTLWISTHAASWERVLLPEDRNAVVLESEEVRWETPWNEAVVSWNVEPADGAGISVEASAWDGERWSRFYRLGDWSLQGEVPIRRSSVRGESDADGVVKTDTLVMRRAVSAIRLRLRLYGTLADDPGRIRWVTVSVAHSEVRVLPRGPRREVWGQVLEVPERSQVAYRDGKAWCSPTSVAMILAWWAGELGRPELNLDVPEVASGVHDPGWPGTGNWSFNAAFAGSVAGMRACAARLRDLRDVEDLIAVGIPVVLSVNAPVLRGRPAAADGGHLILGVGFTEAGDVVANDPWARLEEGQRVRRVYARENLERAWEHSLRLAYLIAPEAKASRFPAAWDAGRRGGRVR